MVALMAKNVSAKRQAAMAGMVAYKQRRKAASGISASRHHLRRLSAANKHRRWQRGVIFRQHARRARISAATANEKE